MPAAAQQVDSAKIAARQAEITGKPPRIAPLKPEEVSQDAQEVGNAIRKGVGLPPSTEIQDYAATMLRYPTLYRKHSELAVEFFTGAIGVRDRELMVLRIAWLCQAPYEWGEHVKIGKRLAKLTSEDIERVVQGSGAPGWNEHERALLRAVEELRKNAIISDATWGALAKSLDEKQLLELPLLIGQYQGVAYLQNSLRVRLLPDNPGLSAR